MVISSYPVSIVMRIFNRVNVNSLDSNLTNSSSVGERITVTVVLAVSLDYNLDSNGVIGKRSVIVNSVSSVSMLVGFN